MTTKDTKRKGLRYVTPEGSQAESEPGSRGRVLRNLLGITRKADMDRIEYQALVRAQDVYLERVGPETRFTAGMLCAMHREWLGGIYAWAGEYRTVELQKGSFRWPPAYLVERNMQAFDQELLRTHTPCPAEALPRLARRMAEVHGELLLIHPFRDGNGRLARWLADVMALQAGLPAPKYDFEGRGGSGRRLFYLAAVTRAYGKDYEPLVEFFVAAIEARLPARR